MEFVLFSAWHTLCSVVCSISLTFNSTFFIFIFFGIFLGLLYNIFQCAHMGLRDSICFGKVTFESLKIVVFLKTEFLENEGSNYAESGSQLLQNSH